VILSGLLASASGLVVLVGQGATIDAKADAALAAELGASRRVVLAVGAPESAPDPFAGGAPADARIAIDPAAPRSGDERRTAESALGAGCIVLTGGDVSDWSKILIPGGSTTRLSEAIRDAQRGGASVVGVGAAAPFLAQWCTVEFATLGKAERNPRHVRADVGVGGLGLFDELLVDSSACPRGEPMRALRAAFDGNHGTLLFLEGPVVFVGDPKSRSARIFGTGTALVFDFSAGRRTRDAWREGRLALLTGGDSWSARAGAACAAPSLEIDAAKVGGPWDDPRGRALSDALGRGTARLSIHVDERTRLRAASVASPGSASGLAFDLTWGPSGS